MPLTLPQGYTTSLEGTFQAQEEAMLRIGVLSLISLSTIFIVLYSRYRSAVLALIIMATIPMALIGSVVALHVAEQPLSVASMIGFITLAGISARNGILKISHYINLVLHEGERFGPDLVIRGSLERLTPVLMTALSASLALTPLLFGADEAGREILHPVAVTIFGGLLSATMLECSRRSSSSRSAESPWSSLSRSSKPRSRRPKHSSAPASEARPPLQHPHHELRKRKGH
jgi:heavy-metal exporter, HME family